MEQQKLYVIDENSWIFRVEYEKRVRREAQKYAAEIVQKQMLGD